MGEGRVLIVGCGAPQLGLLRYARTLGLEVVGADLNPGAIGVRECDTFVRASTGEPEAIAAAVRASGATGIASCGSEVAVATTARAAERLGLPFYADVATIDRCQSKDLMRAAYLAGGAPVPVFVAATTLDELARFRAEHGLPLIVKPSRGWGQRGVAKVEHDAELAPSFAAAQAASSTGVVMVEGFLEGREFSVNAYTRAGETRVYSVTERVITEYPDPPGITFAEWFPSGLDAATEAKVVDAAVLGARALGIVRGPSYTQMRVGPKGAFIVETAHRLGGGLDPDVAWLASGTSLFRKILGVAMARDDWEAAGPESAPHGGAIGKFLIGTPGRVVRIEGLEAARAMPGIAGAEVWVPVGGTVHPLTDGSKRAGHVLAHGLDRDDAAANASRAAAAIRIVTEPT